jgi:phosphatidylglycerophosphatase A
VLAGGVSLWGVAAVFFLFRIFDIAKPFPANRSQRLPGGWGIVIDDVIAGIYTRIAIVILASFYPALGSFWA